MFLLHFPSSPIPSFIGSWTWILWKCFLLLRSTVYGLNRRFLSRSLRALHLNLGMYTLTFSIFLGCIPTLLYLAGILGSLWLNFWYFQVLLAVEFSPLILLILLMSVVFREEKEITLLLPSFFQKTSIHLVLNHPCVYVTLGSYFFCFSEF